MDDRDPFIELYAEIGKFIVEFEALLQHTRDTITHYYAVDGIAEYGPLDILMYDSTSFPLSNYFSAISLHVLAIRHSDKNKKDIEKVSTLIRAIARHLKEAGELRNDIVHSSFELSSVYGNDPRLEARRPKITSEGIQFKSLKIEPNIFDSVTSQIFCLFRVIQIVGDIIESDDLNIRLYENGEELKRANELNFVEERKRLFK